jgi:hypothetical protein
MVTGSTNSILAASIEALEIAQREQRDGFTVVDEVVG